MLRMSLLFISLALVSEKSFANHLVNSESVLDLKEVLEIAKENNPGLIAVKEKLNEYEAQKQINKSALYPTLNYLLTSAYQKDALYTGSPKFNGNSYNLYTSDLKLNQTLYAFGALSSVTQADYSKKIQQINIEIQERLLTQNVIEAFYRFILNQQSLENLLKNQSILQQALTTSNQRYNAGRGQMLDILQVKTQLALVQPLVEQARNQFEIAGQQLASFMGEKEHPSFKLKGRLKTLLLKDVEKYIDLKSYHLPEYELNQLQLSLLDYSRDVLLGKEYPTLKLVGDYLYNNYKKSDLFSDYSHAWAVQIQLTIPLFSGFSSTEEKQLIASQNTQLLIARRDLENNLTLKQVTSLKNLQTSETSLVSSELAVKLSEQSQNEASRLYKISQIDFLQFLNVEQAALQAKSSLDQLKFQSILAYSNYFVATGQPLRILVDVLTDEAK